MAATRINRLAVPVVLLLVGVALAPSIGFPYVWDAVPAVQKNALVQSGSMSAIWTSDYWRGTAMPDHTLYRPVTVLSFALERWALGASDPRLSHLVNLVLHAGAALLLMLLVRRAAKRDDLAAAAGLLFACHPLLLLTAVNVVGRADLLATGFSLAAMGCLAGPGPYSRAAAWGAAPLLLLALGSKEVALATPFLMVIQATVLHGPLRLRDRAWWLERACVLAPSGIAIVVYLVLRTGAVEGFPGAPYSAALDNVLVGVHGLPRVATGLALLARYARLLLVPYPLSVDYSGAAIALERSLLGILPLAGLVVLGALTAFALSRSRVLRLGGLLFLLPYLLVGNVLVLNGAGFAERLVYFSATGFCFLAAAALVALHRRVAITALAVLLLGGVLCARMQLPAWRSDEALLEAGLRATPRSLRAHFALAELRMGQGRDADALRLYDEALQLSPDHEASWLYKGVLEARRGDVVAAERCARRALELQPAFGEARAFLGVLLKREARVTEAERELRKALLARPPILDARAELGLLLFESGRYAEAVPYLRESVQRGLKRLQPTLMEAERRKGVRPL